MKRASSETNPFADLVQIADLVVLADLLDLANVLMQFVKSLVVAKLLVFADLVMFAGPVCFVGTELSACLRVPAGLRICVVPGNSEGSRRLAGQMRFAGLRICIQSWTLIQPLPADGLIHPHLDGCSAFQPQCQCLRGERLSLQHSSAQEAPCASQRVCIHHYLGCTPGNENQALMS